jgi:hypothetical protein
MAKVLPSPNMVKALVTHDDFMASGEIQVVPEFQNTHEILN